MLEIEGAEEILWKHFHEIWKNCNPESTFAEGSLQKVNFVYNLMDTSNLQSTFVEGSLLKAIYGDNL